MTKRNETDKKRKIVTDRQTDQQTDGQSGVYSRLHATKNDEKLSLDVFAF